MKKQYKNNEKRTPEKVYFGVVYYGFGVTVGIVLIDVETIIWKVITIFGMFVFAYFLLSIVEEKRQL